MGFDGVAHLGRRESRRRFDVPFAICVVELLINNYSIQRVTWSRLRLDYYHR